MIKQPNWNSFIIMSEERSKLYKKEKFFFRITSRRIEDKLKSQSGGMGIYLIMLLSKVFKGLESTHHLLKQDLCTEHLDRCLAELKLNKKEFYKFYNQWVEFE